MEKIYTVEVKKQYHISLTENDNDFIVSCIRDDGEIMFEAASIDKKSLLDIKILRKFISDIMRGVFKLEEEAEAM